MAEREFQTILAELCVNDAARRRFLSGDETAVPIDALTESELARLRTLRRTGADGLKLFAGILGTKRRARVRSLLPNAAAYVSDASWTEAWEAYTSSDNGGPPRDPRRDAAAFAFFAAQKLRPSDGLAVELLDYDGTFNAVAVEVRPSRVVAPTSWPSSLAEARRLAPLASAPRAVRRVSSDIVAWLATRAPRGSPRAVARDVTVLFFRPFGAERVRTATVGSVAPALLERADGTSSLESMLEALTRRERDEPDHGPFWRLVVRLCEARALCFIDTGTMRDGEPW